MLERAAPPRRSSRPGNLYPMVEIGDIHVKRRPGLEVTGQLRYDGPELLLGQVGLHAVDPGGRHQ